GMGEGDPEVLRAIEKAKYCSFKLNMVGKLNNFELLREYYRNADIFVMPSRRETFGLVYIEALSQGTPIIYSMNDGVGGYFEQGEVGFGIRLPIAKEVEEGVEYIIDNYSCISRRCIESVSSYKWAKITEQYLTLYNF